MKQLTSPQSGQRALWPAIALMLVALLLAAPAGIALAQNGSPFAANVVTATTTANLRIRSAPSLDAEVLDTLPSGSVVGFTGFVDESGDWVQVDAADGPVGWVWADFLSNVPDGLSIRGATSSPAPAEDPFAPNVVTATTTVNLNVRDRPSTDANLLSTLPVNTTIGFTGFTDSSGDWVQVDAADAPVGWVWADYLSSVPEGLVALGADGTVVAPPAGTTTEPPFSADVVTATTTRNLNIRNMPGNDAQLLDTLPSGTVVGFTGLVDQTGDWVQVDAANGPVGWVWAAYLSNMPDNLTVWSPSS